MRNLSIVCIEKDFVAWSSPSEATNSSDSGGNSLNTILKQIQDVSDDSPKETTLKKYREEYLLN
jgi:hypothetical protein